MEEAPPSYHVGGDNDVAAARSKENPWKMRQLRCDRGAVSVGEGGRRGEEDAELVSELNQMHYQT